MSNSILAATTEHNELEFQSQKEAPNRLKITERIEKPVVGIRK